MSVILLNISSLPYHVDKRTELLNNNLTINFKIIGVTENRLRQNKTPLNSIDLPNYK